MKNKGFTLIELLGTIVIIGVLGTIAIASVVNIKKSSNERFNKAQIEIIRQAGQNYFTDNKKLLPIVEGQSNYVTLDTLIEKNYIDKVYDAKKNEFMTETNSDGMPGTYVWIQKQESGEYGYGVYYTINGVVGGEGLPFSGRNTSKIQFQYIGDFHTSNGIHYTNGKSDAYVQLTFAEDIKKYKYEILKDDKQFKVGEISTLSGSTIKIKLNAKSYAEGKYKIRVTTYNEAGRFYREEIGESIYVDKTAPSCEVLTDYNYYKNAKGENWYSSKSTKNGKTLGVDKKLPIYATGEEEKGSGVGSVSIYGDSGYRNLLNSAKSAKVTYDASNTTVDGKMYYAVVEDNVGNKSYCKKSFKIDTEVPTCDRVSVAEFGSGEIKEAQGAVDETGKTWYNQQVMISAIFSDGTVMLSAPKDDEYSIAPFEYTDQAGNEGKCDLNMGVDRIKPDLSKAYLAYEILASVGGSTDSIELNPINLLPRDESKTSITLKYSTDHFVPIIGPDGEGGWTQRPGYLVLFGLNDTNFKKTDENFKNWVLSFNDYSGSNCTLVNNTQDDVWSSKIYMTFKEECLANGFTAGVHNISDWNFNLTVYDKAGNSATVAQNSIKLKYSYENGGYFTLTYSK